MLRVAALSQPEARSPLQDDETVCVKRQSIVVQERTLFRLKDCYLHIQNIYVQLYSCIESHLRDWAVQRRTVWWMVSSGAGIHKTKIAKRVDSVLTSLKRYS